MVLGGIEADDINYDRNIDEPIDFSVDILTYLYKTNPNAPEIIVSTIGSTLYL